MVKLAPDRLVRALKDDAAELNDVVRMMPEIDADADKKKLEAALRLARAMVFLLNELLMETSGPFDVQPNTIGE